MASRLIHVSSGEVLADRMEFARTHLERMRGLLGRSGLGPGEGLMLERCSSIHTFFMRFPLDVVFLSHDLTVRKICRELPPWRFAGALGAKHVVELPAGTLKNTSIAEGDALQIEKAP